MVGRQPYAPAAFTPGEIPGTHFQRLSRPQGTWFCRKEPRIKSPVTPPGIYQLVAQRLNHYATPGPNIIIIIIIIITKTKIAYHYAFRTSPILKFA